MAARLSSLAIAMLVTAMGQDPASRFRFRAEVNLLQVDVIVTDGNGDFVTDLEREDFELYENGIRREIETFGLVHLPERAERPSAPRGTAAPESPLASGLDDVGTNVGTQAGRIFVLVLDDLHVDAQRSSRVRELVRDFVTNELRPEDLVSISFTSGRSRSFGASRQAVVETIDTFIGQRIRSATLERLDARDQAAGGSDLVDRYVTTPAERQRGQRNLDALRYLRAQCEYLESVTGRRKALLWFSEGLDYDVSSPGGRPYARSILSELNALQDRAARANVAIYSINPRGLNSAGDDVIQVSTGASSVATVGVNDSIYAPGAAFATEDAALGTESMLTDRRTAVRSLRHLAEMTGGLSIAQQNDLAAGLRRIVDDSGQYYLLGFAPRRDGDPDELQRIEVRVSRPGVEVRAREGYVAAAQGEDAARSASQWGDSAGSPALREALALPIPTDQLALRVNATPMGQRGELALVPVTVTSAVDTFQFEERNGRIHDDVEVWIGAFDAQGRLADSHTSRVNLALPADLRAQVLEDGFRSTGTLELSPGVYQLRIGVHEEGAARTGSVMMEIEIPPLDRDLLRGFGLSSAAEAQIPVAGFDRDGPLPAPMVTTRTFERSDELIAFLELVNPDEVEFDLAMTVRSAEGITVARFEAAAPWSKDEDVTVVSRRVPLADLQRGRYEIVFRALDAEGNERAAKALRFSVH